MCLLFTRVVSIQQKQSYLLGCCSMEEHNFCMIPSKPLSVFHALPLQHSNILRFLYTISDHIRAHSNLVSIFFYKVPHFWPLVNLKMANLWFLCSNLSFHWSFENMQTMLYTTTHMSSLILSIISCYDSIVMPLS